MADEWIKMRLDLGADPKVIAISKALQIPRAEVVGHLHAVWSWADKHCRDGKARGVGLEYVDELSRPGFAAAMKTEGWLDDPIGWLEFPDFDTHNGQSAKTRADAAKRQNRSRSRRAKVTDLSQGSVTNLGHALLSSNAVDGVVKDQKPLPASTRKKPGHPFPADFELNDERRDYAVEKLGSLVDTTALFDQFKSSHLSKDSRFTDWGKAWQTWVLNGLRFGFPKKTPEGPIGRMSRAGAEGAAAATRWIGASPPPAAPAVITHERIPGED